MIDNIYFYGESQQLLSIEVISKNCEVLGYGE